MLLLIAINFHTSWSLALNCTYGMQTFTPIGSIYTCQAGVLSDGSDTVSIIYGNHQVGKTDSDVQGFVLQSQGLDFVPRNVESFFPNIRAVDVYNNLISSIKNFHLRPFTNLVHFAVMENKLNSLDSNLFEGLTFLNYVSFKNNSIQHVGHDFILPSSGEVHFDSNECISFNAVNSAQIDNLRFKLLLLCPPTISQIEDTLESRPNLLTNVNNDVQSLEIRVAYLEAQIELLVSKISQNKN